MIWLSRFSSQGRLLASHSALAVIAQGLRLAASLLIIPITLTYLGKERYGLWMLTMSTLTFIGLLDAGLTPTLKNRMSEAYARLNEEEFHFYAAGGFVLACLAMAAGLSILPLLALVNWPAVYGVTGHVSRAEAQGLTMVCFGVSVLTVALSFVEALFAARLRLGTVYIYNSVAAVAGIAVALAAVHIRAGVIALAAGVSAPQIVARLTLLIQARRQGLIRFSTPWRRVVPLLWDVMPSSASFLAIELTHMIIGAAPSLIASRWSGLTTVSVLAVGQRVTMMPLTFVAAIVPVFWPAFTIAWARNDVAWIRRHYRRLVGGTAALLGLYACLIVLLGPPALRLWLHGTLSVPRPVLAVLGIWLVFQGIGHWLSTLLHSIADLSVQVVCYSAQAVLAIGLGAAFCATYGLLGLAISMTAALGFANLAPLSWRVHRKLGMAR